MQDARSMLQPVLRAFQLRRVMASEGAGALTPLYEIMTVELAMTKVQADHYWKVHQDYAEGLDQVYDWEKKQG